MWVPHSFPVDEMTPLFVGRPSCSSEEGGARGVREVDGTVCHGTARGWRVTHEDVRRNPCRGHAQHSDARVLSHVDRKWTPSRTGVNAPLVTQRSKCGTSVPLFQKAFCLCGFKIRHQTQLCTVRLKQSLQPFTSVLLIMWTPGVIMKVTPPDGRGLRTVR